MTLEDCVRSRALLTFRILLGCVVVGVSVRCFAVLFTAAGLTGKFADEKRQKATEGRRQRTENGRQKTEDG